MSRGYFLSFYLILMLLPLLECHLLENPLLANSALKIDHTHGEAPDDFLVIDSFTDLQLGQPKPRQGNIQSILDFTKGGLTKLFKTRTRTQTPESTGSISWKVCYSIAQKASRSSKSPEVQNLATAVLAIGPHFDLYQTNAQVKIQDVKYAINLHSLALENDSLNTAQMIWSIGVLSFLRSQLPEEDRYSLYSEIPDVWTAKDLGRPRRQLLLFFLQDKNLGKVAKEMWSEVPSKLETSEYVTQEAIQRESIVHSIQKEMVVSRDRLLAEFQTIYLAFINLETRINSEKASSLMQLLINHLNRLNILKRNSFKEEENTVRLLVHLQEYNYESYLQFIRSTESRDLQETILASDIRFQLADESLPPGVRSLLTEFQNKKPINGPQINRVLDSLSQEKISTPQLGRYFRALNFVFNRSRGMYTYFHHRLNDYPKIMPKLFEMLTQRRYGQIDPDLFAKDSLEYLIYRENEDLVSKKYRNALAEVLVAKGVLSARDTAENSHNLGGVSKQNLLTSMLYSIFKKVSEAKTFEHSDKETDAALAEYILQLISFKTGHGMLYRHLIAYKQGPERLAAHQTKVFETLSQEIVQFVKSWDIHGSDGFSKALQELEGRILSTAHMEKVAIKDDTLSDWTEVTTGRIGKSRKP